MWYNVSFSMAILDLILSVDVECLMRRKIRNYEFEIIWKRPSFSLSWYFGGTEGSHKILIKWACLVAET
jgi:hypothetical protein